MCKVSVNGTRKRRNQPITEFQHAKVNLNPHTQIEERDVGSRRNLTHLLTRSRDKHALVFNEEVTFEIL